MAMRRAAARSGEWAQHFSNASCLYMQWSAKAECCKEQEKKQLDRLKGLLIVHAIHDQICGFMYCNSTATFKLEVVTLILS